VIDAQKRRRLIELLREKSFEKKRFVLTSGRESDFFIDCKQTVLTAEGHALVGELMLAMLDDLPSCDAVAGVELGGCPLASAVSLVSFHTGKNLPALYVRKAQKEHGTAKLIEGDRAMFPGIRVALLEDVITTGGSSLRAVASLRSAGAEVVGIAALVERQEGGAEAIDKAGLSLVALARRENFMS
jgi:orotate phosphoribosyltransferase